MKIYNCPDCQRTDSCDGCYRLPHSNQLTDAPNTWTLSLTENMPQIPDACRGCQNHPSNGGSGICHCILGIQEFTC